MTLDAVLVQARLREVAALERVRQSIVDNASDDAWAYVLGVIDHRLCELEMLLKREDPHVVRECLEQLKTVVTTEHEFRNAITESPAPLPELPRSRRVH